MKLNAVQAIRDSCKKEEDAEKDQVEIRPLIRLVSDASYGYISTDFSYYQHYTIYFSHSAHTHEKFQQIDQKVWTLRK